jgi:hypothetical protein
MQAGYDVTYASPVFQYVEHFTILHPTRLTHAAAVCRPAAVSETERVAPSASITMSKQSVCQLIIDFTAFV